MLKEFPMALSPSPSWIGTIGPIFIEHAILFPSVPSAAEMADYSSWKGNYKQYLLWFKEWKATGTIVQQLRFLTDSEKEMVFLWLANAQDSWKPLFLNIESKDELMKALQTAIELEFATLPPYLTAMFSLRDPHNKNIEIYDRFHRIVLEEMKHFALACNMLVAIGGKPIINSPDAIPKYPGPLPGGVGKHLEIHLAKFSIEQLTKFMFIELPDFYRVPDGANLCVTVKSKRYREPNTIGDFYAQIVKAFEYLDSNGTLTYGHCDRQVDVKIDKGVETFKITNLHTAKKAIHEIVVEGEGGGKKEKDPDLDPFDELGEPSHYYKFAEIYYGKAISKEERGYCYSGDRIDFDSSAVYDFPSDPNIADLTPGTREYEAALDFATKFKQMVDDLQNTFAQGAEHIDDAIKDMGELPEKAQTLMELGYGPSFQLPLS